MELKQGHAMRREIWREGVYAALDNGRIALGRPAKYDSAGELLPTYRDGIPHHDLFAQDWVRVD